MEVANNVGRVSMGSQSHLGASCSVHSIVGVKEALQYCSVLLLYTKPFLMCWKLVEWPRSIICIYISCLSMVSEYAEGHSSLHSQSRVWTQSPKRAFDSTMLWGVLRNLLSFSRRFAAVSGLNSFFK